MLFSCLYWIYFWVPNLMIRFGAALEARDCLYLPVARPLILSPNLGVPKELHFFSVLRILKRKLRDVTYKHLSVSLDYDFP